MEEDDELKRDQVQTLTLALFDLYWFHRLILFHLPPPPPPPHPPPPPSLPPPPPPETDVEDAATPASLLLRRRLSHRRSLSDGLSPSPTLHPCLPKLQTILSGKEAVDGHEIRGSVASVYDGERRRRRRRRDRRRRQRSTASKSLSELEFEEVKGFMDLGFTFSDVDADPRLMEIVPGLQRLKPSPAAEEEEEEEAAADDEVARPYLSEAWDDEEEEEEIEAGKTGNFEIPIVGGDGVDLKDQLRFWAHAVASTVR